MLLDHILLDRESAALYIDVDLQNLNEESPLNARWFSLRFLETFRLASNSRGDFRHASETIVYIKTPARGWYSVIEQAILPGRKESDLLKQAASYLESSPFILNIIDVLYWLNDHQLCKQKSIDAVAESLSRQGVFRLAKISKSDKAFKRFAERLYAPPFLTADVNQAKY